MAAVQMVRSPIALDVVAEGKGGGGVHVGGQGHSPCPSPSPQGWPTTLICCYTFFLMLLALQKFQKNTGYSWCSVLNSLLILIINCGLQYTLHVRQPSAPHHVPWHVLPLLPTHLTLPHLTTILPSSSSASPPRTPHLGLPCLLSITHLTLARCLSIALPASPPASHARAAAAVVVRCRSGE